MRNFIAIAALCLCLAAGLSACEKNPAQEYGKAVTGSLEKADRAADRANIEALEKSIAAYRAENDAYPASLDEIAPAMGLDPSRFSYDPATGKVGLR